jgi:lipopolysaccharide cholinephosphotransferase
MKHIDIDECHTILLSLAAAFDEICKRHHIPYYMLGGTMLGAVRHQGFIPWDDDMDFGVERTYFPKLLKALSEELPAHFKVRTLDNSDQIFSNFFKIEDIRTEVVDHWHDSPMGIGICIDIFPLDNGRKNYVQTRLLAMYIFVLLIIKDYVYFDPAFRRGFKKLIAKIIRKTNFISIQKNLNYVDRLIIKHTQASSGYMINYYGRWRKKEIMPKKIFGTPQAYQFENITLKGTENADAYLSALYGNYMQLPPEEMRFGHIKAMHYK